MPNTVAGATGTELIEWARRAETAGFSTLATIGAVSYPGYEELTVLAAAGAVTERIGLMPNVLIAPARSSAELAKQAATTYLLSGGRLTLGLGIGWRPADHQLTDRDFNTRGQRFDEQLRDLEKAWAHEPLADGTRSVAPTALNRPVPLLLGGTADASVRRVVKFADGWTAGGLPPDATREMAEKVRAAWKESGRQGNPKIAALAYFSLGDVEESSRAYLLDYYTVMSPDIAEMIASSALRSRDALAGAVEAYAAAGVDEFILSPTVSAPEQVDLLAEAVL
jgi:alkanesulfonate monooxygenase SsuD/methylene tetrahydromethanopterin reductase-like flavin-dependent oxidoreductase (luciferase family)